VHRGGRGQSFDTKRFIRRCRAQRCRICGRIESIGGAAQGCRCAGTYRCQRRGLRLRSRPWSGCSRYCVGGVRTHRSASLLEEIVFACTSTNGAGNAYPLPGETAHRTTGSREPQRMKGAKAPNLRRVSRTIRILWSRTALALYPYWSSPGGLSPRPAHRPTRCSCSRRLPSFYSR